MATLPPGFAKITTDLARRLHLQRPIAFIDLETTGTNPHKDRIIEIAVVKILPNGTSDVRVLRINPEIAIPEAASAIHGIHDSDVSGQPTFKEVAASLDAYLGDCDFAGFGVRHFDLRLLESEFARAGRSFSTAERSVVDAMLIFFAREARDLAGAIRFYRGETLEKGHTAEADTLASIDVLAAQLARYADLPQNVAELSRQFGGRTREPNWIDDEGILAWEDDRIQLNFGKHRGTLLAEVAENDPAYLDWMLSGDFTDAVKDAILAARLGSPQRGLPKA